MRLICTSTNQVANRQDNINTKELHVLHCITYTPGIRSPGPASKSIQMQSSRTKSIHRSNITIHTMFTRTINESEQRHA